MRLRFEIERLKSEIERYRLVTFNNNNNNNNNENNNNQKLLKVSQLSQKKKISTNSDASAAANGNVKGDNSFEIIQHNDLPLNQRHHNIIAFF